MPMSVNLNGSERKKPHKSKQAWYNMLMPELPEVETIVNGLRGPLIGRTFTGVCYPPLSQVLAAASY